MYFPHNTYRAFSLSMQIHNYPTTNWSQVIYHPWDCLQHCWNKPIPTLTRKSIADERRIICLFWTPNFGNTTTLQEHWYYSRTFWLHTGICLPICLFTYSITGSFLNGHQPLAKNWTEFQKKIFCRQISK